eukprot:SAG22_NODE_2638_length_2347_cov_2.305605_4_plen_147_part_00
MGGAGGVSQSPAGPSASELGLRVYDVEQHHIKKCPKKCLLSITGMGVTFLNQAKPVETHLCSEINVCSNIGEASHRGQSWAGGGGCVEGLVDERLAGGIILIVGVARTTACLLTVCSSCTFCSTALTSAVLSRFALHMQAMPKLCC